MIAFRSFLFSVVFYSLTACFAVLLLPFLLLPRTVARWIASRWTRASIALVGIICGVRWQIKGEENIKPGPVIYASKHQSAWETLALWAILPGSLYVLKRELLWLPLIGWYLKRVGNIAINRAAGAGALKDMISQSKAALAEDDIIVVFPEGTRVKPHETKSFNPGIAALYAQANTPVVPIALNSGLCWPRNSFLKKPGLITIEFLPAIAPGLRPRDFLAVLEKTINEATARIGG